MLEIFNKNLQLINLDEYSPPTHNLSPKDLFISGLSSKINKLVPEENPSIIIRLLSKLKEKPPSFEYSLLTFEENLAEFYITIEKIENIYRLLIETREILKEKSNALIKLKEKFSEITDQLPNLRFFGWGIKSDENFNNFITNVENLTLFVRNKLNLKKKLEEVGC